jgi:hypothetical protein
MPRTKRGMVIAVCRVAPARAIPDLDEDGKSGAGDGELPLPYPESPMLYRIYWSDR